MCLFAAPDDYEMLNSTLIFSIDDAIVRERCINVSVTADLLVEAEDTFSVSLAGDRPVVISESMDTAIVTIIDDSSKFTTAYCTY